MSATAALKGAIGWIAQTPPAARRLRGSLAGRVAVAYLHYVGPWRSYYADFYRGPELEGFARDLDLLGRYFDFAPLRDVVEGHPGSSRPLLAITFDDGFELVRTGVADVLEERGIKATTFVITDMIGNRNLMWRNKLSAIRALREPQVYLRRYDELARDAGLPAAAAPERLLPATTAWPAAQKDALADELWSRCEMPPLAQYLAEEQPYFTWEGLSEWRSRGHEVGLHTRTHPFCHRLAPDEVETEVVDAAHELRTRFDLDFLAFSYPFGERLDAAAERALFERGTFDCAFGIRGFAPRGTAPYRLERASIEGDLEFPVFGKALLGRPG